MKCHEVDYEIFGDDMQVVEIELDPSETVIAEAGAMNWMDNGISFEAKMGDGSQPDRGIFDTLLNAGKRALTGESIFITHFTNTSAGKKRVAFAAPYPGKIVPIAMAEFGGEGFILQRLKGDGMAFVHAGGTIVKKELNNDTLLVDTGCIVCFTPGIDYDIQRAGNLKSMFFGGEGLFLATLRGRGTVYLQSLPFSRLADRIIRHAPSVGGRSKGEGSILGGLGRLLDGDR